MLRKKQVCVEYVFSGKYLVDLLDEISTYFKKRQNIDDEKIQSLLQDMTLAYDTSESCFIATIYLYKGRHDG